MSDEIVYAQEPETIVEVREVIQVVTEGIQGPTGPPGADGGTRPAIYFDHGDATPAILETLPSDRVIRSVMLTVIEAFNGTGAKVSIGTADEPELLMDEDSSDLSVLSNYEAWPMETIDEGTQILAFITSGLGATTGRCMVLFEFAEA